MQFQQQFVEVGASLVGPMNGVKCLGSASLTSTQVVRSLHSSNQKLEFKWLLGFLDFRTALVGHFEDGLMKAAQVASLKTIIDDGGIKVPIFTEPRGPYYKVWPINQFHSVDFSPLTPGPSIA